MSQPTAGRGASAVRIVLALLMLAASSAAVWVGWQVRPLVAALGWDWAPVIWMMGSYVTQAVGWLLGAVAFLRPGPRGARVGCACLGLLVLMNLSTPLLAYPLVMVSAARLPLAEGRATAHLMVVYAVGAELLAWACIVFLARRPRAWAGPGPQTHPEAQG